METNSRALQEVADRDNKIEEKRREEKKRKTFRVAIATHANEKNKYNTIEEKQWKAKQRNVLERPIFTSRITFFTRLLVDHSVLFASVATAGVSNAAARERDITKRKHLITVLRCALRDIESGAMHFVSVGSVRFGLIVK